MSNPKVEVVITYCTQCQWLLRAAWLAQELLSTFTDDLSRVCLEPGTGGVFRITCDGVQIWERKADGGHLAGELLGFCGLKRADLPEEALQDISIEVTLPGGLVLGPMAVGHAGCWPSSAAPQLALVFPRKTALGRHGTFLEQRLQTQSEIESTRVGTLLVEFSRAAKQV